MIYTIGQDGYRKDIDTDSAMVIFTEDHMHLVRDSNDNQTISYYLYEQYNISTKNMGVHGFGITTLALYNYTTGYQNLKW